MTVLKFDELLSLVMALPLEERERLLRLLSPHEQGPGEMPLMVRDNVAAGYGLDVRDGLRQENRSMVSITVMLPDDLARQVREAGLLGGGAAEAVFRRALRQKNIGHSGPADARKTARIPKVYSMGQSRIDLTKALSVASSLEDEAILEKKSRQE